MISSMPWTVIPLFLSLGAEVGGYVTAGSACGVAVGAYIYFVAKREGQQRAGRNLAAAFTLLLVMGALWWMLGIDAGACFGLNLKP